MALLEPPHTPNGTNMIGMHLAARSIRAVNGRDHLGFKSGNLIAKIANSLLRLTRHAVCSFLVRKAGGMTLQNQNSQEFTTYANDLLRSVQVCESVDSICRRLRSGREISRVRPEIPCKLSALLFWYISTRPSTYRIGMNSYVDVILDT